MKNILILSVIFFVLLSCKHRNNNQVVSSNEENAISFIVNAYNFDTLNFNEDAVYKFIFHNTGKQVLIINDVKTSCGCTIADFPKKPIKKGKGGAVKVKYDTKRVGNFNKTIRVYTNVREQPYLLNINGFVRSENE